MLELQKQKGFTLVELAIVLVIIGLLIGGILKGQQLMENASVTATVAQVKGIEAAVTSFKDSYGELPGDLSEANAKINNCAADLCIPNGPGDTRFAPGDGIIGNEDWDMIQFQPGSALINVNDGVQTPAVDNGFETLLFWYSLEQAGLISAVKEGALTNSGHAFGNTVPATKIAGGFWVGYSDGANGGTPNAFLGNAAGMYTTQFNYTMLGSILTLVPEPGIDLEVVLADSNPVIATVAAAIDRKLDDGLPSSGSVQAYGMEGLGGCTVLMPVGAPTMELYNESNERLDCGVHLTIQQ